MWMRTCVAPLLDVGGSWFTYMYAFKVMSNLSKKVLTYLNAVASDQSHDVWCLMTDT